MKNVDVKNSIKKAGFKQWQVCEVLNINESAFSRKLRHELSFKEKKQIFEAIEKLSKKEA